MSLSLYAAIQSIFPLPRCRTSFAGVHFRADAAEGLRLGEPVAIRYLREMKLTAREFFAGFHLRQFEGTQVTV